MAPEISDEMKQELEKVTDRAFETLAHEINMPSLTEKTRFTKAGQEETVWIVFTL